MERAGLTVGTREAEREWTWEDLPVLRARSALPEPEGLRRAERFYRLQERLFYRCCERDLRRSAEAAARCALENGELPRRALAELSWRETYRAGRLWSLCTIVREDAEPGPPFERQWGDTWDIKSGFPVPVSDCFPAGYPWRRRFFAAAEAEIERQERLGRARYFPGWRRKLRRYFNPRRYYLTEAGVVFFYPMYALCPAGIPAFVLPWEGEAPLFSISA